MYRYERKYIRRELKDGTNQLATKAGVSAASSLVNRGLASVFCRPPYPNYFMCNAFNNEAEKQGQEFGIAVLALGLSAILLSL